MFSFWNKRSRHTLNLLAGTVALLGSLSFPSLSLADFDPYLTRSSESQSPPLLKFQYRLYPAAEVEKLDVSQSGKALEGRHTPFANNPLNTCAILILVDTSVGSTRAPRDHTLADNKQFISALLDKAQPSNLIGVYAFANDLVEVAPIGSPFPEIRTKIASMKADGLGTRIYRQGMNAVDKLAPVNASRKALVILSDGKDEDNGFTRDDLVKAALKQGVMVFAMGCPETETDIPSLGNLEKITVETRGLYTRALIGSANSNARLRVDSDFAQAILDSVTSGGEVVAPLDTADPNTEIVLQITTKTGATFRYLHQRSGSAQTTSQTVGSSLAPIPPPAELPAATPSLTAGASNAQPVSNPVLPTAQAKEKVAPAKRISPGINIANIITGSSVVLLVTAVLILRRRKKPETVQSIAPTAYLLMQDAESKRLPLTKTANRIGRRPDNDIVFANTSISGYHAEIHAQRDGSYRITDLGSGNGVSVNSERVTQSELKDGDLIELGEVRFRFYRG